MTSALAEARALREEAVRHKRLSRHHRRQARQAMRRLDEFCREHGIATELVTKDDTSK